MSRSISTSSTSQTEQGVAWPTGTAALAGGCLLAVFYITHAALAIGLLDGRPGPFWQAMFLAESVGLLLIMLSVPGWCSPRSSVSGFALIGAVLLSGGLLIWALAGASNLTPDGQLPIPTPTWLYTALVAVGSPIVAATCLRTHNTPVGAVILVGVCGLLGMVLLATPEWVYVLSGLDIDWPVPPLPGELVLALYAFAWSWAGQAKRLTSRKVN
jgi:hypothetical protein